VLNWLVKSLDEVRSLAVEVPRLGDFATVECWIQQKWKDTDVEFVNCVGSPT